MTNKFRNISAERREREQRYSRFYERLKNFLKNNSGFPVKGVARVGSRTTGTHRTTSDLDVIFWIQGDPLKRDVYPELADKLKNGFKVQADIGSSYNVINIWKNKISCDLVLRTEAGYRSQLSTRRYNE